MLKVKVKNTITEENKMKQRKMFYQYVIISMYFIDIIRNSTTDCFTKYLITKHQFNT